MADPSSGTDDSNNAALIHDIQIASICSSSCSLVASIILGALLLSYKSDSKLSWRHSTASGWLIVLCFADFFYAATEVTFHSTRLAMGIYDVSQVSVAACQLEGFCVQFFFTISALTTLWLMLGVWSRLTRNVSRIRIPRQNRPLLLAIALLLPAATAVLPLFGTSFAAYETTTTSICWIGQDFVTARLTLFWGPLTVCLVLILVMYVHMLITFASAAMSVRSHSSDDGSNAPIGRALNQVKRYGAYPIVILAAWLPGIVNRFEEVDPNNRFTGGGAVSQAVFMPSQGFLNFLVFIFVESFYVGYDEDERPTRLLAAGVATACAAPCRASRGLVKLIVRCTSRGPRCSVGDCDDKALELRGWTAPPLTRPSAKSAGSDVASVTDLGSNVGSIRSLSSVRSGKSLASNASSHASSSKSGGKSPAPRCLRGLKSQKPPAMSCRLEGDCEWDAPSQITEEDSYDARFEDALTPEQHGEGSADRSESRHKVRRV